jgi:TusA-related sulfurtransferase
MVTGSQVNELVDRAVFSIRNPKSAIPNRREVGTMSDEISVAKVMDLKGLACPMPIVKVSKGIKEVEVGEVLQAVTSDPGALSDFPAWAKTSGTEILKIETEGKETSFYSNIENLVLWARSEVIGSAICPIYSWFQVSGVRCQ